MFSGSDGNGSILVLFIVVTVFKSIFFSKIGGAWIHLMAAEVVVKEYICISNCFLVE